MCNLSKSQYKDNFILKGGLLISSMLGVAERTTMDMDTTVTVIDMDEKEIEHVIQEIFKIDTTDGVIFVFEKLEPIRDNDDYNNYRAHFVAHYGKIANPMKLDITTGDEITPCAIEYSYRTILDDEKIDIMAYNVETIIAEKYETIIRRNIGTTRARDFYDLYMFYNMYRQIIDPEILRYAVVRTAKKRESLALLAEWKEIIEDMKDDVFLGDLWKNYCMNNAYAVHIDFESVMEAAEKIGEMIDSLTG